MDLRKFEEAHEALLESVASPAASASTEGLGRGSKACKLAESDLADQTWHVRMYNRAVLAVALATAAGLIVAIWMAFFTESRSGAIAGAIGSVVTGVAMGFVLKMRSDARKQKDVLRRHRDKYCRIALDAPRAELPDS